jgi:selenoprotein W-related protein
MDVRILYCRPCGYEDRANGLAAELRERFGATVRIEEGRLGQFDVLLDGEVVATKGRAFWQRWLKHGAPPRDEVLAAIERRTAPREGDACEIPRTAEG